MKINTYDPYKQINIIAGEVTGNIFYRKIKDNHYFRLENGYAIQEEVFDRLKKMGVKKIVLLKGNESYEANLNTWYGAGHLVNYGHGEQIVLSVDEMIKR